MKRHEVINGMDSHPLVKHDRGHRKIRRLGGTGRFLYSKGGGLGNGLT